ncbi:MAG: exodeoxyribonuclease VII large subunit [Betaproteobacteria bacterium]|nr:MAG: exodeoxyribonuclease VII large subunit [Betaproteobacteria bacterium]
MPSEPDLTRVSSPFPAEILTVSALARSVRDLLEHRYPLAWVAGEISNCVRAKSGHLYFSLKDELAQVRCVMFRNRGQYLDWEPREGLRVEVRALVTLYEARGDFQLNVESMRRAGQGALFEAFLRLRDKLEKEGLFDAAHKKPLPFYPRRIGIVTSLQAAALRDVLTTLARRNPSIPVIVYPAQVQGEGAVQQLAAAIAAAASRNECDVLILCRGGGSIEDLWAFNDEGLARAIHACPIPLLTGIGHETDFTIAEFVADRRAATPTAAAELASPARADLIARITALRAGLSGRAARKIEDSMQQVDQLLRRMVHPGQKLQNQRDLLAQLTQRLRTACARVLERQRWQLLDLNQRQRAALPPLPEWNRRVAAARARLALAWRNRIEHAEAEMRALGAHLAHLDPRAVLQRGYSVVRDSSGAILRSAGTLSPGDAVDITFSQGGAEARVVRTRR